MITVPLVPPSPNELRRKYRNPHVYRKLRKLWEEELFYGASCARHRNALMIEAENYRMRVKIIIHHPKEYDQDNLYGSLKPVLDALKNIHFIKDDDRYFLELEPVEQVVSPEKKTILILTPQLLLDRQDLEASISS